MAITSLCAKLISGQGVDQCVAPVRKYYQQAVIINKSDIDTFTVNKPDYENGTVQYNVTFALKAGTTGYRFNGPEAGSNYFGSFDKTRSDNGYAQYTHNVQVLLMGVTEDTKTILEGFDKGSYVAVLQLKDGTVEVFGFDNGLSTTDYTFNVQEGGGGATVMLSSLDDAPEGGLPLVYISATPGSESADFDANFEVPAAP